MNNEEKGLEPRIALAEARRQAEVLVSREASLLSDKHPEFEVRSTVLPNGHAELWLVARLPESEGPHIPIRRSE